MSPSDADHAPRPSAPAFAGDTAVVTGGTRGIGRAIALDLLEHGARVYATWNANEAAARAFEDEGARFDGRLCLARFDVADAASVDAFWSRAEAESPRGVQVLVCNSGVRRDALAAAMADEDWQRVLDTNLTGSFRMIKRGLHAMLPLRYGRIVLITSPAARHGFEGQANYSASKAGQIGLMRSVAREVGRRGITVNCVSPGFIDTELIAGLSADVKERYLASVPLRRLGRPEEVAYAVRALVSREASYISGATLEVAGGL